MAKIPINIKTGTVEKTEKDVVVGIDLGTTNSLVAHVVDGQPKAVLDRSGRHALIPSVVHFDPNGDVIVGEAAKEKLRTHPARTIYSVKRLMGKSYADIADLHHVLGYRVLDEDTESLVKIQVDDRFYTPIELSAQILRVLKQNIEEAIGQSVSKAVITVPAYFNDAQRQATRDAGKLAGLDVLRIVNEPTAASLAYGMGLRADDEQTIAVYDLGGGTFDISILHIQNGIFEVLSTHGDTFLGGDDFDQAIVDHWMEELGFSRDHLRSDKSIGQHLRLVAEQAKRHLSTNDAFEYRSDNLNVSLTRAAFEARIAGLVSRTIQSCQRALADAHRTPSDIDCVVMVGGSTRVPLVKHEVQAFFQKTVFDDLNPDEVVALGAAIQADILAGNRRDLLLLDITPLSLGIETLGGLMDVIIPRNNRVPSKADRQYTTSVDGQKNLKIAVFQGERDLVEDNRKLGEFILQDIPPMPAGLPKIDIQFILDADGILTVRARELRSHVETSVEINPQYGISEAEMARMLLDSIEHAEKDMHTRALLETRNEARAMVQAGERFLAQNNDWLEPEQKEVITQAIADIRGVVDTQDKDAIQSAVQSLNAYTAPLAQQAMDRTIKGALRGKKL